VDAEAKHRAGAANDGDDERKSEAALLASFEHCADELDERLHALTITSAARRQSETRRDPRAPRHRVEKRAPAGVPARLRVYEKSF